MLRLKKCTCLKPCVLKPEESDGVTYNYSCDLFQCELNSIVGSAQAPQRTLAGLGRGTTRPRRPGGACVEAVVERAYVEL